MEINEDMGNLLRTHERLGLVFRQCGQQGVHFPLYLVLLFGEDAVPGQSSTGKEQGLSARAYLGAAYVDEYVCLGPQVHGTEVAAIVEALVALEQADEVPCLHLGESAQGRCGMQHAQYPHWCSGLGEVEGVVCA